MVATGKAKKNNSNYAKIGAIIAAVVVLCGISFVAGMGYQKGHTKTATSQNTGQFGQGGNQGGFGGPGGGFRNGQRPNVGEVKAVSSDSITISNQRSGSDQTFKLTSSTSVNNDGNSASVSDIKVGDTVVIQTDSSDTSTATQIILNPNFQGPQPSSSSQDDSSSVNTQST